MARSEYKVQAQDRKLGMSLPEVVNAIENAKTTGFLYLGRTEVGFKGQIQSMTFHDKENK